MDHTVDGQDTGGQDAVTLLERLKSEHAQLKERLSQLESHLALTADEQIERVRIKKLKLATKDRIAAVTAELNKG